MSIPHMFFNCCSMNISFKNFRIYIRYHELNLFFNLSLFLTLEFNCIYFQIIADDFGVVKKVPNL